MSLKKCRIAQSKISGDNCEGGSLPVEAREDEDQQVKFKEIIDLLVAAGYFRARIKGLSPFDKVVGGMTWCISNCSFDVDVNLLFQENSTIGQKISLTEKIVSVLPKMNCPQRIEPHQIQGLDFKSIFPVIQWLVKRVIETREEMGDHIRAYSISQFDKHYKLPSDHDMQSHNFALQEATLVLHDVYRPVRKYKCNDKDSLFTEEAKISSTLLEYGRKALLHRKKVDKGHVLEKSESMDQDQAKELQRTFSQIPHENEAGAVSAEDEEEALRKAQEKTLQSLMKGMSAMSGREIEGKVASKVVGSIVEMQSAEIHEITSKFVQKRAEIEASILMQPKSEEQKHLAIMEKLQKKAEKMSEKCDEVQAECKKMSEIKLDVEKKLNRTHQHKDGVENRIQELKEIEENADKHILQKLRNLVALNENLKLQEQQFKQHCKEESEHMKNEISVLQEEMNEKSSVKNANMSLVEKQCSEDSEKLNKMRFVLAVKNRQAASLSRKVDEVPTRAELTQYQRRFVELYDQVSS